MAQFNFLTASLRTQGAQLVGDIKGDLASANKKASGKLIQSIRFKLVQTASIISAIFTAARHWEVVDKGRGPSKKGGEPGKLKNSIKRWVQQKGIVFSGLTKDQTVFLITRKIHREGFAGTNIFKDRTDEFAKRVALQITQGAFKDVSRESLSIVKQLEKR